MTNNDTALIQKVNQKLAPFGYRFEFADFSLQEYTPLMTCDRKIADAHALKYRINVLSENGHVRFRVTELAFEQSKYDRNWPNIRAEFQALDHLIKSLNAMNLEIPKYHRDWYE